MAITQLLTKLTHNPFLLLILLLSAPVLTTAQSNLATNATGSRTLIDPFTTPSGPFSNGSGNWTWIMATKSYTAISELKVIQTLSLSISPPQNLTSAILGYLGCGIVAHGLTPNVLELGKDDNGDCSSVFDAKCTAALLDNTTSWASDLSTSEFVPIRQICDEFPTQQGWSAHGVPPECEKIFEPRAWLQAFPFASPQIPPSQPLFAYGASTYTTTNTTAYDNLTTTITPLLSVIFANHTTDYNSDLGYSQSRLTCLRPSNVQPGSRVSTGIPSSKAMRVEVGWVLGLVTMTVGLMKVCGFS